jgi:hypothetical protein
LRGVTSMAVTTHKKAVTKTTRAMNA